MPICSDPNSRAEYRLPGDLTRIAAGELSQCPVFYSRYLTVRQDRERDRRLREAGIASRDAGDRSIYESARNQVILDHLTGWANLRDDQDNPVADLSTIDPPQIIPTLESVLSNEEMNSLAWNLGSNTPLPLEKKASTWPSPSVTAKSAPAAAYTAAIPTNDASTDPAPAKA